MNLLLLFSFMFSIFDHSIQTEKSLIAQTLSGNLNMVASFMANVQSKNHFLTDLKMYVDEHRKRQVLY